MNGSRFLVEKITCVMGETRVWAMGVPFLFDPFRVGNGGRFYTVDVVHGYSVSRLRRDDQSSPAPGSTRDDR
jgi:hypothetical protein